MIRVTAVIASATIIVYELSVDRSEEESYWNFVADVILLAIAIIMIGWAT